MHLSYCVFCCYFGVRSFYLHRKFSVDQDAILSWLLGHLSCIVSLDCNSFYRAWFYPGLFYHSPEHAESRLMLPVTGRTDRSVQEQMWSQTLGTIVTDGDGPPVRRVPFFRSYELERWGGNAGKCWRVCFLKSNETIKIHEGPKNGNKRNF